ncbi:MAG: outer membrane beta-barrel protein [Hylemonella sp.]|nr:outer membrane beta-barrel protein [Hylemonella sp.]
MKKLHHTLVSTLCVAAAALAGASVQAQGSGSDSVYSLYGRGTTHIGFNAGLTDYKLNDGTGLFGSDKNSTAYNIYAGSYFTDSNLGMEVGYTDFGKVSRAGGSTKADGINVSLIGRLPLGSSFSLLGKVGTTYSRTDVSAAAGSGVTSGSQSGFGWSYGVGAEYAFSRQWSGVLQYDEHNVAYAGSVNDRINITSLGVRYRY